MDNYKLKVNDEFEIELKSAAIGNLDITQANDGTYHLVHQQKVYKIELLQTDYANKKIQLKLNGEIQTIQIEDQYDQLIKKLGLSVSNAQKINDIKAPMPGLVLDIVVEVGQEIQKGDGLIVLEAMKMENMIKSAGEGVVKSILIDKGAAVDKGQILIEME